MLFVQRSMAAAVTGSRHASLQTVCVTLCLKELAVAAFAARRHDVFHRFGLESRRAVIFTALHVCRAVFPIEILSVRLSNACIVTKRKGASKATILSFPYKNGLCWKKVCCKVCLCENYQQQSCKAFTGLSIRAQMVGGDVPSSRNFRPTWRTPFWNGDFQAIFSRTICIVKISKKCSYH